MYVMTTFQGQTIKCIHYCYLYKIVYYNNVEWEDNFTLVKLRIKNVNIKFIICEELVKIWERNVW